MIGGAVGPDMSVIADLSIDADQFLLGRLVADFPALSVEIERLVPTKRRPMPYIWGYGKRLDEFVTAMAASEHVVAIQVLDEFEDRALYRIEWDDPAEAMIGGLAETGATILEAHSGDAWTVRVRFEDHRGLVTFDEYCTAQNITYRLERISSLSDAVGTTETASLTLPQHEALSLALEEGYFEVPRRVTLAELARELDISVQALSERLRRGTKMALDLVLNTRSGPTLAKPTESRREE